MDNKAKIKQIIVTDSGFLNLRPAYILDDSKTMKNLYLLLMSVYCYLETRDSFVTEDSFREYMDKGVLTYWVYGKSPDYHRINCTTMMLQDVSARPFAYADNILFRNRKEEADLQYTILGIVYMQNLKSLLEALKTMLDENAKKQAVF